MPVISMFYGIIVYLYYYYNKEHNTPHIHVEYQEYQAVVSILEGEILSGELPKNKLRLLYAWIEIHKDEILANWKLAVSGEQIFKIEPLK
ncbi:MAG: hypothetical protein HW421_3840 [Ignavibacteria bacterium]|nr:hypothetical protein [Ignavibacteria bacterium]